MAGHLTHTITEQSWDAIKKYGLSLKDGESRFFNIAGVWDENDSGLQTGRCRGIITNLNGSFLKTLILSSSPIQERIYDGYTAKWRDVTTYKYDN